MNIAGRTVLVMWYVTGERTHHAFLMLRGSPV